MDFSKCLHSIFLPRADIRFGDHIKPEKIKWEKGNDDG